MGRRTSPNALAVWLGLPLILLAAAGVWLVRAERRQAEGDVRREAERWAAIGLELVGSAAVEESIEALAVVVPTSEPKEPFPEAGELAQAREEIKSGRAEAALERLAALRSRPGVAAGVSQAGLPMVPLIERLAYEAQPDAAAAERLARAAVVHPSLLSQALIDDAAASLTPERAAEWRRLGAESTAMARALARGESAAGWHFESPPDGPRRAFPVADVSRVVNNAAMPTGRLLPPGLGLRVEWFGYPVVESRGEELATRSRAPWRLAITQADPAALRSAAARRVRWLAAIWTAALAVTGWALWVAWRSFRRQEEWARLQMEFIASVSHELRTPVASITALTERLESGQADTEQTRQYHRFISREGRRLAALVENVLDFARLERGKRAFTFEPADLPALIRDSAALVRPRAEEKAVSLTESIDEVPEALWPAVDTVAVRQLVLNLLDNAVKFTPAGGRIELSFTREADSVVIRVSDTGIGIEPVHHERIFEKFYRIDNSLTRETTGAGIGLSLVRGIAEAHGARVDVESVPGESTRFSVRFPITPCASC